MGEAETCQRDGRFFTTGFEIRRRKEVNGPVEYLIDGKDENSWVADRGVGLRNQPSVAVVQFEQPLEFPDGSQLKIVWRMGDMLGCARFSLTTRHQSDSTRR